MRKILSGVARAGERYGRRKIAAMLIGELEDLPEPLTGSVHDGDPARYAGRDGRTLDRCDRSGRAVARVRRSVSDAVSDHARPRCHDRSRGGRAHRRAAKPTGAVCANERRGRYSTKAADSSSAPLQPIVDALRAWRLDEARRNAIAPFVDPARSHPDCDRVGAPTLAGRVELRSLGLAQPSWPATGMRF